MEDTEIEKWLESQDQMLDSERKNLELGGNTSTGAGYGVEGTPRQTIANIKNMFQTEDWVYISVDLLAGCFSRLEPCIKKTVVNEDGEKSEEELSDHPARELLEYPNPDTTGTAFQYVMAAEYCLAGNAYFYMPSRGSGLWQMASEMVEPDIHEMGGGIKGYFWTNDLYTTPSGMKSTAVKLDAKDVGHVKRPNPSSLYFGLSPFLAGNRALTLHRYSHEYLTSFYQKGATPQIVLSSEKAIGQAAMLRILRSFEQAYTGRANQRRALFLPQGIKAEPIMSKIADTELLETIKMNRETVTQILRIPKHAVSLAQSGSLGSEEAKVAMRMMWSDAVIPMRDAISDALTRFFRAKGILELDEYVYYPCDHIEALQDSESDKAARAVQMLQAGLSINEVRSKVWNERTIENPDADLPWVMVQSRPQLPAFGQAFGQTVPNITPLENLTENPVTPPLTEPDPEPEERQLSDSEKLLLAKKELIEDHWDSFTKAEADPVDDFSRLLLKQWSKKLDIALRLWKNAEKAFDEGKFKRELEDAYSDLSAEYVDESANITTRTASVGTDIQLGFIRNTPNSDQVAAIAAGKKAEHRLMLRERGLTVFQGASEYETEQIMGKIEAGLKQGDPPGTISASIGDMFKEWAGYRRDRIVRTESLTALSLGQATTMDAMKEVYGDELEVMWITANDERVRDSHDFLHGDRVKYGEDFGNGLRYPRDTRGSAEDVINCRCSMVPVLKDDIGEIA